MTDDTDRSETDAEHDGTDDATSNEQEQDNTARDVQTGIQAASTAASAAQQTAALAQASSPEAAVGSATGLAGSAAGAAGQAAAGSDAAQAVQTATQATQAAAGATQSVAQAAAGNPAGAVSSAAGAAGATTALAGAPGAGAATQAAGGAAGGAASALSGVASAASAVQSVAPVLETLSDVAELLDFGGSDRIEPVTYELRVVQGPQIEANVVRARVEEALGRPYEMWLDLSIDDLDAAVDELLGASVELALTRTEQMKAIPGVIDCVDHLGIDDELLQLRVRVVPAFALLAQHVDSRVFQGFTVPEILAAVLSEHLEPYRRQVDTTSFLSGEYNARDYCTQFRESTLAFCSRLMEEEGIAFFFVADGDEHREKLVLIDSNDDYADLVFVGEEDVNIIPQREEEASEESIQGVQWSWPRQPNKVATHAMNLKGPSADDAQEEAPDEHHPAVREVFVHGERRQITEDPDEDPMAETFTGEGLDQREPMATHRLQLYTARSKLLRGTSNVTAFAPGLVFTLGEHPRADLDGQRFLLTAVVHEAQGADARERAAARNADYRNRFEAIPLEHVFRPALRTPKPKVEGIQTAVVVGQGDEEIYTDQHGRIRIKYSWDRHCEDDAAASCWVRVTQPWAGPGWGFVFIPRVGMEVIVQFIDGNPDRPIVSGSVYNGENAPPYTLPDEKTKSVIKTSSSPGGDGYNELTFEDAAGAEQIIVHAQKDLNETVENDHTTTVHANQTDSVDGNQSVSVGGNQSNTVSKNQTEAVTGDVDITIKGTRTHTVTGLETVTLKNARETTVGKTELHEVTELLTEKYHGGRDTKIDSGDTLTVITGDRTVDVSAGALNSTAKTKIQLKQGGEHVFTLEGKAELSTSSDFKITNGKSAVESEGGKLKLTAADELSLVCGAASVKLAKDGSIDIQGAKKAVMGTPGSSLSAEPAAVSITSAKIAATAMGIHEIKGALVKIN